MSVSDDWDVTLRERFTKLKAEDAERAPDFDAMYGAAVEADSGPVRRADRWAPAARWGVVATTLAAAALAGILLTKPDLDSEFDALIASYSVEFGGAQWHSPTAALLTAPGSDLISNVPSISGSFRLPLIPPTQGNDT